MDPIQALVLGVIQGLTEFLPISSSAHLIFVPWLLGWDDESISSLHFSAALHLGTLLAVLVYFARDWRRLITAGVRSVLERRIGSDPDRRLAWSVALGTVPAAVVGALLEDRVDALFYASSDLRIALSIIAIMMLVMGALLLLAERLGAQRLDLAALPIRTALAIGVAQALALVPGVSRSGSTITAGLLLGLKRETAARFSFLLATPIVLGLGIQQAYKLATERGGIPPELQTGFAVGFTASAVSGFLCIHFLLRYLQRRSTAPFIVYRFLVGASLLALVLLGFRA